MKKKIVYIRELQGNDENDGLSDGTPVLTKKRALEIARKEKTQGFDIRGTAAFKEKFFSGS